jgi:hypothetical protein
LTPWLLVAALCATEVAAQVLDAIVARVDRGVVTWSEVLQEREVLRLQGAPEPSREPKEVADDLIRRRLLVAEAEKLRLPVDAEAVAAKVRPFLDGDSGNVWPSLQRLGLDRGALESRARELVLMDQYLGLRREMTFVPESEIRKSYASQAGGPAQGSLAVARDELRAKLAEKVFQEELNQWIDRQVKEGRVVRNPLPPL